MPNNTTLILQIQPKWFSIYFVCKVPCGYEVEVLKGALLSKSRQNLTKKLIKPPQSLIQIECHISLVQLQGSSTLSNEAKSLSHRKDITHTIMYGIHTKSDHQHNITKLYATYHDPILSSSPDILFTQFFHYTKLSTYQRGIASTITS